jgi:hypothetical protein
MTRLIESSDDIGLSESEIRACPGAIREIHDDVLRDLMTTPHATERRHAPMGPMPDSETLGHPRRRVCV